MADSDLVVIFVISWIASLIVGTIIGNNKGRLAEGLLLSILLGWIGVLITALLSDPTRARREQLSVQREELNIEIQRAQLAQLMGTQAPANPVHIPPKQASSHQSIGVTRLGKQVGEYDLRQIDELLRQGQLKGSDHYFDQAAGEWRTLTTLFLDIEEPWTCRCGRVNRLGTNFCEACKRSRDAII